MDILSILLPYVFLIAGSAILILCGNWLVTGGVNLARHFKISTLVVGLTIVAFGTSAPELFVSIGASFKGAPDIAIGNVIGSNIANIALVLGFTAIILPIPANIKSIKIDLIIMLVLTVLFFILGFNGIIGRIEGIILFSILVGYIVWSIKKGVPETDNTDEVNDQTVIKPLLALLVVTGSVTGMYFGSQWFINGARDIAVMWGVSERVIGISIVALGTSLPELVTSVIAAFRKEMDISIGNIIGSNIFNIAMVLGVSSAIKPLNVADIPAFTIDMIWVFGIALLLLLALVPIKRNYNISRWKGIILLAMYVIYIYTLY